jgi:ABC-2 type transport system ATP-binding protein
MRADIVASLLHNPNVLFLDEPTIGLDVVAKNQMRQAIKRLNKEFNTTVILTTHDLDDIALLANRIIMIDKGTIIYQGTLEENSRTTSGL